MPLFLPICVKIINVSRPDTISCPNTLITHNAKALFSLFLPPARASRCDLRSRHQVANVLLQELVIVVQLVVLLLDGLDAVEDLEEGLLEGFCVSVYLTVSIVL